MVTSDPGSRTARWQNAHAQDWAAAGRLPAWCHLAPPFGISALPRRGIRAAGAARVGGRRPAGGWPGSAPPPRTAGRDDRAWPPTPELTRTVVSLPPGDCPAERLRP